ncbi:MAG: hypothetical protein ACKOQM_14915 [Novosphingobium sp.]
MHQHLRLATLVCTGVAIGAGLAWGVPTEPRSARNAQLEQLSQVRVTTYPGAGQAVAGPDSYPIEYSPQWLAVAQAAERARLAKLVPPDPAPPLAYDQPPPERDLAVEGAGIGEQDDPGEALPEPQAESPPQT